MATRQKLKDYKKLSPRNKAIMLMLQEATLIIQHDLWEAGKEDGLLTKIHFKSAKHDTRKKEIRITYVTHVKEVDNDRSSG